MTRCLALLLGVMILLAGSPDEIRAQVDSVSRRSAPVTAADSAIERMTTILASELRCPVCQGNSIQDSPSELALQMRDVIREQLHAGKTPDEVRGYFVDKYGEWILLAPKAEGLNLVVYLIPLAAVLAGGLIVWRTVRRWTATTDRTQPDA